MWLFIAPNEYVAMSGLDTLVFSLCSKRYLAIPATDNARGTSYNMPRIDTSSCLEDSLHLRARGLSTPAVAIRRLVSECPKRPRLAISEYPANMPITVELSPIDVWPNVNDLVLTPSNQWCPSLHGVRSRRMLRFHACVLSSCQLFLPA